jgi:hypothetical protein
MIKEYNNEILTGIAARYYIVDDENNVHKLVQTYIQT